MKCKTSKQCPNEMRCFHLGRFDYLLISTNFAVRLYCAFSMIISDCDETFNYWEPLNVLLRGFGKQTWEYSPEYAIRSYFYLIPYYLATSPLRDFVALTSKTVPPYYYFYFIRLICLCGFTSFTEIMLFHSVRKNISSEVARWFLLVSSVSAGMGHASSALLPSSFAMNWVTLGTSFALSSFRNVPQDTSWSAVYAIACFLVAGLVGWPFTLALGLGFGIYTLWYRRLQLLWIFMSCIFFLTILVVTMVIVDSFYYRKGYVFIPINIVLYNVFATEGEGPEIFGVEPFIYYVQNLLLNFNVLFIAAYLATILIAVFKSHQMMKLVCIIIPLWVWSFVFGSQPHKEERFLYPIYPLISLAAAIFYVDIFQFVKDHFKCRLSSKVLKITCGLFITFVLALRMINLVENYSAPLKVTKSINSISNLFDEQANVNVCVGREWYHFPTSVFLPANFRLRFVKSSFDGLLPGDFAEGLSISDVTSITPPNMNSKNLFSQDKIIDLAMCDLIIDNSMPSDPSVGDPPLWLEKDVLNPSYEIIHCSKMINVGGNNRGIGRILYVPSYIRSIVGYQVDYMDFCLLSPKSNLSS